MSLGAAVMVLMLFPAAAEQQVPASPGVVSEPPPQGAAAQSAPPEHGFRHYENIGNACLENLDYECAEQNFNRAIERMSANPSIAKEIKTLIKARLLAHIGLTRIGMEDPAGALEYMIEALLLFPGLDLAEETRSPKVRNIIDSARRQAEKIRQQRAEERRLEAERKQREAEEARRLAAERKKRELLEKPRPTLMRMAIGLPLLFGEDDSSFQTGLLVEPNFELRILDQLYTEFFLSFLLLPIDEDTASPGPGQVMGLGGGAGLNYAIMLSRFRLAAGLSAGYQLFGRDELTDGRALLLRVPLRAEMNLTPIFSAGIGVAPTASIAGNKVSATLGLMFNLTGGF